MRKGCSPRRILIVCGIVGVLIGIAGLLSACAGGPEPMPTSPPTATSPTSSPSPTAIGAEAIRAEVEEAYLRYWDVYASALLELDPSGLDQVLTGDALRIVTQQVEEQRAKNQPVRIRVEHHLRITILDATTASVEDRYVNHSVRLDPDTMEPIEPDPNQRVRRSYTLEKVGEVWKVSFIIGYE